MAEHRFRRELGLWDLVMVNMGAIIGSGWLLAALAAANLAGPASIIAWLFGTASSFLIAPFFVELGSVLPETGSLARYTQYTQSGLVSFMVGWATYLGWVAFPPLETVAMIQYASPWFPSLFQNGSLTGTGFLVGLGLLAAFLLLNLSSVRLLARVNNVAVAWKLAVPFATAAALILVSHHTQNLVASGGFTPFGTSGIFAALSSGGVLLTYTGFRHAIDMAGEARNPERDIPKAVYISILLSTIVYVALEVAFVLAVPPNQLIHGWAHLQMAAPFAAVAGLLGLGWLVLLLRIDAVISPADTALVNLTGAARTGHALARGRFFPARLAKLNSRGEPVYSLWLTYLVGILFLLPFPSWRAMAGIVSDVLVITYVTGPVAVAVLRREGPHLRRPTSVPWLPLLGPAAFALGSLLVYWSGWPTVGEVMLAEFLGLIVYVVSYLRRGKPSHELRSSLWFPAYLVAITALSLFGSFQNLAPTDTLLSGRPVIPGPWDSLAVAAVSFAFYTWGLRSGRLTGAFEGIRPHLEGLQRGHVIQSETGFEGRPLRAEGRGEFPRSHPMPGED